MRRSLRYSGRIYKDLRRLETADQRRILAALENFAISGDGDVRPLHGEFAGSHRLRVGKWRVFLLIRDAEVVAHRIDNRGEAY